MYILYKLCVLAVLWPVFLDMFESLQNACKDDSPSVFL